MIQNLLPENEKSEINKAYKKRLLIAYLVAAFFSFSIASVIFIPPFLMAGSKIYQISIGKNKLLASKEQEEALTFPQVVEAKSRLVLSSKNEILMSDRVSQIYSLRPEGLILTDFSYDKDAKNTTDKNMQVSISGVASTRNNLLSFEKKIKELPFVESTSIPVSNLAKDRDLPFSMSISIKLKVNQEQ